MNARSACGADSSCSIERAASLTPIAYPLLTFAAAFIALASRL
jgi:hypothetical protein